MVKLNRRDVLAILGTSCVIPAACASGGISGAGIQAQTGRSLIYSNKLEKPEDIEGFRLEGDAHRAFENGRLTMENARPPEDGQLANFVHWCPEVFPRDIEVSWEFQALREPGLCVFFFNATGILGDKTVSVLDPGLAPRNGVYDQYVNGDVHSLQISYFRRRWPEEQRFHLSILRKAPGFELLQQGADPLPPVDKMNGPYRMKVRRQDRTITFSIDDLTIFSWTAPDGLDLPRGGNIGFRQMAPLKAAYSNLQVHAI